MRIKEAQMSTFIEFTVSALQATIIHIHVYTHQANKDLSMIPILLTCPLNVLGGKPFVSGSATISSVPICSINTFLFCTSS